MDLMTELPMGFGMALAQNAQALNCFSNMTKNQQQAVIEQTHTIPVSYTHLRLSLHRMYCR